MKKKKPAYFWGVRCSKCGVLERVYFRRHKSKLTCEKGGKSEWIKLEVVE